jgi:hypothetical protein
MTSFVGALTLCWFVSGGRLSAGDVESTESLRKEKLKVAQEWWDLIMTREQLGAARAGLDVWYKAAKAVKDAELDVAQDKSSRIRALTTYRDRMQKLNNWATVQGEAASIDDYQAKELKIAFLDAKIDLKKEQTAK